MEQSFKQTEVGLIPEDWHCAKIEDVATTSMCKRIFADQTTENGEIPFYKIGTFGKVADAYISRALYTEYRNRFSFPQKGDVLISAAGTLGRTVVYDGKDAYFQDSNIVWLDIDKKALCNEYLNHYYRVIKWASSEGSTIARLYNGIIYATNIALPPLDEQKCIAQALSDVDSMISSLEKLIAKKKAIKQGAMQDLLTCKKRLPGFTGEWEGYTIGKMGEFYSGLSGKSKKDFDCGEAYYITFLNVLSNVKIDTSILASVDVRENESQNAVRKGDLFFNTSSETPEEVGMCAVLDEELENTYLNSFCFGFRLFDDTHDPLFLSYYLNSAIGRKIMSVLAQGATRYNLSKNNFAETVIKLPVKEEQTAIASILSDMDNEIEALEQKLTKARQIKQGMMQQLLTGKIRLV